MNYTVLNEALKNLYTLRQGTPVETVSNEENNYEGKIEIYKISDDVYVRLSIYEDSYGENESVSGIEFVQPTEVKVTNFTPLK